MRRPVAAFFASFGRWFPRRILIFSLLLGFTGLLLLFKSEDRSSTRAEDIAACGRPDPADSRGAQRIVFKRREQPAHYHYFVQNSQTGVLVVFNGIVLNQYTEPRSLIRLCANLLTGDEKKRLAVGYSYAGNVLSQEELRNLSFEEIEARLMNPEGSERPNRNLLPDVGLPFMLVFADLPPETGAYYLGVESSRLGSRIGRRPGKIPARPNNNERP